MSPLKLFNPSSGDRPPGPRRLAWWMLALLGLLAVTVYVNSLNNGFAYDDVAIIRDSPRVHYLDWIAVWTDNYWPRTEGVQPDALYRPITIWSYLANEAITPAFPWAFHLVNVLLHALVTILVCLLSWRFVPDRRVALLVGILFAVHPLHTEAVANIVGRAELLAALWSLLMLLVYLPSRPLADETAPPHRPLWHGFLVAACFLVAILSKETPVTLLPGVVLLDLWRWTRWQKSIRPSLWRWMQSQALRYYVPLGAAFLFYLVIRIPACGHVPLPLVMAFIRPALLVAILSLALAFALDLLRALARRNIPALAAWPISRFAAGFLLLGQLVLLAGRMVRFFGPSGFMSNMRVIHPIVNPLVDASLPQRVVTPFLLFAKYLALFFWPVHLSADYSAPSLMPTANILHPLPLIGLLTCILAIIACFRFWRSRPLVTLLIVLFFSAYFLVSNVTRIGTIFGERLFYWPSAFLLILLAWALVWASARLIALRAFALTGTLGALLLAATLGMARITWVRNTDWADNITLAIATARDNPQSAKACSWAGSVLVLADRPDFNQIGVELLQRSAQLAPDYVMPRWELAKYWGRHNELPRSVIYFAQAVRLDAGSQVAHDAAQAILKDFRKASPDSYMPELLANQHDHPDDASAYLALALAYHAQGKLDLARQTARKALDLAASRHDSGRPEAYHEAGAEYAAILLDEGKIEPAINEYRIYIANLQDSAQAHCTYAAALLSVDPAAFPTCYAEAQINLQIAQALDPANPSIPQLRERLNMLARAQGAHAQLSDVKPPHDLDAPRVPGGAQR